MKPMSGENSHRSHDRDEVFADAPERHQKLDSDEELEAAFYQELIEISGCTQPLGPEPDKAGEKTGSLR
jgi:hypothetical protein